MPGFKLQTFLISPLCLVFFLGLGSRPALGASRVEGRVVTSLKATGFFDLRVQVWDKGSGQPRLLQTIDIPKVEVHEGRFEISIDPGPGINLDNGNSLKIESRVFESWEPFRPAELSGVHTT